MTPTRLFALLLLPLAIPAAAVAQSADSYFITVFGSGSNPLRAHRTHTFATFTHVHETPAGPVVANDTISWMPAALRIRSLALRPELGVNLTQEQTFRWIESKGIRTSIWGPFEIKPERYAAYLERKAELESGDVRYRAIGGFTKDAAVSNCGQSFSRAGINGDRFLQPTPFPGEQGTSELVKRAVRAAAAEGRTLVERPELRPAVVTDPYPLTPREPGERISRFRR